MRTVFSSILPFKGFFAMNLLGLVVVRKEYKDWYDDNASESRKEFVKRTEMHEYIHTLQMREMLYVFFYIWYVTEWFVRLFVNGPRKAYRSISFEVEAYRYQSDKNYPSSRKHYAWARGNKTK